MFEKVADNYVCSYVVRKVAETFNPHYFQITMTDMLEILSKSEYYLSGLSYEELKKVYGQYICNKSKFEDCFINSFSSSKEMLERASSEYKEKYFDEFFVTTIENFIEYEKRKFGIEK